MLFRRRPRESSRAEQWQQLAAQLKLQECTDGRQLLADRLDLDSTPLAGAVYRTTNTGELQLYAFDFLSDVRVPGQSVLAVGCLIHADQAFCPVPLRMDRQLRSQLAGIQAGASGARVVTVGSDDGFDERVTVVARDVERAAELLTTEVRQSALRLLERDAYTPTLTANAQQLLAQVDAARFALASLPDLLSDLMSLYVAMSASSAAKGGLRADA